MSPRCAGEVAVIGAGIQGVLLALELAERGVSVHLFDKAPAALDQASRWNEGKLHLGYVYAADGGLSTAQEMVLGSQVFIATVERFLGRTIPQRAYSRPFVYARHVDSRLNADELDRYYLKVSELVAAHNVPGPYGSERVRRLSARECAAIYDPEYVTDAWQTGEFALDTHWVADALSAVVADHPRIQAHWNTAIAAVERKGRGFGLVGSTGQRWGRFGHVVNAAWCGRLALDQGMGIHAPASWRFRFKLGAKSCLPANDAVSSTIVNGPFGDVVNFNDGGLYLSWYPISCQWMVDVVQPPDWYAAQVDIDAPATCAAIFAELARIQPRLAGINWDSDLAALRGGVIYSLGDVDFDDRRDLFHARDRAGPKANGNFISIDTGKYTTAARYAGQVVEMITNG
jgi:glycine/D-amino acid oxidase-like deaminating enzyme